MALRDRLTSAAAALLGISAYQKPPVAGVDIDDPQVRRMRETLGGQLQPLPQTRSRWFLADLEDAQYEVNQGSMRTVAQLCRSMRRDGMLKGLLKTRTAGLVALPKRYRGSQKAIDQLKAENGTRSVFDEMFPPSELALMAQDGILCGVGVAELVRVPGRDHPIMIRHEPEFLQYRWNEARWYFQSVAGMLPITPGDGRWILHTPGGRLNPWNDGMWESLGRAFIIKEHAILNRANFSNKLANPARVAKTLQGATESERAGFLQSLIAWGINQVFELPPGWDVSILESNGRGWEVFGKEIESANLEIMLDLAGQVVTVEGGAGFSNADVHETIRFDLIKDTGDALAHTINTQGIPPWEVAAFGQGILAETVRVSWDVVPPNDRAAEASTIQTLGTGLPALRQAFAAAGQDVDVKEIAARFGVPLTGQEPDPATLEQLPGTGDNESAGDPRIEPQRPAEPDDPAALD